MISLRETFIFGQKSRKIRRHTHTHMLDPHGKISETRKYEGYKPAFSLMILYFVLDFRIYRKYPFFLFKYTHKF